MPIFREKIFDESIFEASIFYEDITGGGVAPPSADVNRISANGDNRITTVNDNRIASGES